VSQPVDELIEQTTASYEQYLQLARLTELSSINQPEFEAPQPPPLGVHFGSK
jgi:hypothetical protein